MKLTKKARAVITAIAPTIGTALGGPLGGMAGVWLSGKLGTSPEDLEKVVMGLDPEGLQKLKRLDQDFEVRMRELDIDVYRLDAGDRASARQLAQTNMTPHIILSALFVTGYFLSLIAFLLGWVEFTDSTRDASLLLLGLVTREVPTIMQFWFGSSHGSKKKSETLAEMENAHRL